MHSWRNFIKIHGVPLMKPILLAFSAQLAGHIFRKYLFFDKYSFHFKIVFHQSFFRPLNEVRSVQFASLIDAQTPANSSNLLQRLRQEPSEQFRNEIVRKAAGLRPAKIQVFVQFWNKIGRL